MVYLILQSYSWFLKHRESVSVSVSVSVTEWVQKVFRTHFPYNMQMQMVLEELLTPFSLT